MLLHEFPADEGEKVILVCKLGRGLIELVNLLVDRLELVEAGVVPAHLCIVELLLRLSRIFVNFAAIDVLALSFPGRLFLALESVKLRSNILKVSLEQITTRHLFVKDDSAAKAKHLHHLFV